MLLLGALGVLGLGALAAMAAAAPRASLLDYDAKFPARKLGIEKVSSIGPANPLPSFHWQGLGVEGSASGFEPAVEPEQDALGAPQAFIPTDYLSELDSHIVWGDPDADGICRRQSACYSPDMRVPLLPNTRQDMFGCERRDTGATGAAAETTLPVASLRTENMLLQLTPSMGGRVWALKFRDRDLVMRARAVQPADYGMRKAWLAGGIEWNWSPGFVGHSVHTLEDVFVARVQTEFDGNEVDVLRVYEFDRLNSTVWQVDLFLDPGQDALFTHVSVHNPNPSSDLNGYWWTNVAQEVEAPGNERIILPAKWDAVGRTSWPNGHFYLQNESPFGVFPGLTGLDRKEVPFTNSDGKTFVVDYSFTRNRPVGQDYFALLCDRGDLRADGDPPLPEHCAMLAEGEAKQAPYIAFVSGDARNPVTTVHGHRGLGTKFFMHNAPGGDNFVQNFMAGVSNASAGRGLYLEAQTGRAPTQMHVVALPKNSTIRWTEWFKGFESFSSPEISLRSANYSKAVEAVQEWKASEDRGLPHAYVRRVEAFLEGVSQTPAAEVLHRGQPWGALEEKRRNERLVSHLDFGSLEELSKSAERVLGVEPYLELLETGRFSAETLASLYPRALLVQEPWLQLIRDSEAKSGPTWLHALLIGTALSERGLLLSAKREFQRSLQLREKNPMALRNLALLQGKGAERSWNLMRTAVLQSQEDVLLCDALVREFAELTLESTPPSVRARRMAVFQAEVIAQLGLTSRKQYPTAFPANFGGDALQRFMVESALGAEEQDWRAACHVLESQCWPLYFKQGVRRGQLLSAWARTLESAATEAAGGVAPTPSQLHALRRQFGIPVGLGGYGSPDKCSELARLMGSNRSDEASAAITV